MKQLTLISLLVIYTMSVIGISVKTFYCCDKLQSVSLTLQSDGKPAAAKKKDDGCCKTKYQSLQVKDNHLASADAKIPVTFPVEITPVFAVYVTIQTTGQQQNEYYRNHAPPLIHPTPIYLSNNVFRV